MEKRQMRLLRAVINLALLSLVVGAMLTVLDTLFSSAYSLGIGFAVALVTLYCYRRSDRSAAFSGEYYVWRYAPVLLFVVLPLLYYLFVEIGNGWTLHGTLLVLRIGASFLLPIACLLYVERGLRRALA